MKEITIPKACGSGLCYSLKTVLKPCGEVNVFSVIEQLLHVNMAGTFLSENRNYGQPVTEKFLSILQQPGQTEV